MLAFVTGSVRGAGDRLLFDLAAQLRADGRRLAGAVQSNDERGPSGPCDMDLHILSGQDVVRISQRLGAGSSGCRLDPAGLEAAVGLALAALEGPVDLVVVNKFGRQEAEEGRGFRPVFAAALERDLPLVTWVNAGQLPAFLEFAGDLAVELPAEPGAVLAWAREACG